VYSVETTACDGKYRYEYVTYTAFGECSVDSTLRQNEQLLSALQDIFYILDITITMYMGRVRNTHLEKLKSFVATP
jgi:hypothetical protein